MGNVIQKNANVRLVTPVPRQGDAKRPPGMVNAFLKEDPQRSWLQLEDRDAASNGKIVGFGPTGAGLDARFGIASCGARPPRVGARR